MDVTATNVGRPVTSILRQALEGVSLETVLLVVVIAATALPLWCTYYLPFTDLPEHVAAMATIGRAFDAASVDAATYTITPLRGQYILYHGTGALLTRLTGDAVLANRLLLTAVAVATPLSARAALRALGRDESLAVLTAMPLLSRPLFVGFLPYVSSLPLYLFGVALVARRSAKSDARSGVLLGLTGLALVLTHLSATTLFLATAVVLEVLLAARSAYPWPGPWAWLKSRAHALVWLAPAALAFGLWTRVGRISFSESVTAPGEIGSMSFLRAVRALPLWSYDIVRSHVDELCGGGFWLLVAIAALAAARWPADATKPTPLATAPRPIAWAARLHPSLAPLLTVLVAYAITPFRIGAAGMLNVRLAPLVALTAILTIGTTASRARRWLLAAGAGLAVMHAANASIEMRAVAEDQMAGFDDLLAAIRPGARLVTLPFGSGRTRTHFSPYPFAGSYHRARGAGVASYSFSDLPHWPVQYRDDARPPQKREPLWIYQPCAYRNGVDGAFYDYVLVGGDVRPFERRPAGPAFREVRRTRTFVLYEKVEGEIWNGPDEGPCTPGR